MMIPERPSLERRVLTALDVDRAVMRPLLRDPSGVVRAQAFVWAAGRDDGAVIDESAAAAVSH